VIDASTGTARLLEGGPIAAEIRAAVAEDVERFTTEQGRPPGLAVVIIGRDAPSTVYLEQILRGCAKVGIDARFAELEGETTESTVVDAIEALNADPAIDGVIVQMPLPPTIRLRTVIDAIDPDKAIRSTPACCDSATTVSYRRRRTRRSRSSAGQASRSPARTRSSSAGRRWSACPLPSSSSRKTRR
jgi:hypothetical protein